MDLGTGRCWGTSGILLDGGVVGVNFAVTFHWALDDALGGAPCRSLCALMAHRKKEGAIIGYRLYQLRPR